MTMVKNIQCENVAVTHKVEVVEMDKQVELRPETL